MKRAAGACAHAVKTCRKVAGKPRKVSTLRVVAIVALAFGVGWAFGGGPVPASELLSRVKVQSPLVIAPADPASR